LANWTSVTSGVSAGRFESQYVTGSSLPSGHSASSQRRQHAVVLALGVVGGPDAQRDEAAAQWAAVALAPADRAGALLAGGEREVA
jgi:hypothetical protein